MQDDLDKHLADIESVSEEVRERAILALGKHNDVHSIFALKRAAREDENLRLRNLARKCLLDLKKEITAVAPDLFQDQTEDPQLNLRRLKSHLADQDPQVRLNAVRSALTFKEKRSVSILSSQLEQETDPVVKGAIVIALGILGKGEILPLLSAVLKKERDPLIRRSVIDGMSYSGEATAYPLILKVLVSDPDKLVERACLKALTRLGKKNLFQLFQKMLGSSRSWRREVVIRALGRFNSEAVVPLLEKALSDPEDSLRVLAQASLARLARHGNAPARALMEQRKLEMGPPREIGEESVLMEHSAVIGLDDADPASRMAAIQLAVATGDLNRFASLRDRLRIESHDKVKAALVTAVFRIGNRSAIPVLKECLKDQLDRVRANAVESLAKVGDETHYPLFIQMLKDKDSRTRANAIVALKKCTYIDPVHYIEQMLSTGDERMIRSAIHAIVELGADKAIALLADLATDGADRGREKALESLEILRERGNATARKLLLRLKGERSAREATSGAESGASSSSISSPSQAIAAPVPSFSVLDSLPELPVAAPVAKATGPSSSRTEAPPPRTEASPSRTEAPPPSRTEAARGPSSSKTAAPPPPEPASAPVKVEPKSGKAPKPAEGGFKLPFDTSQGFWSKATLESIQKWLDGLPAAWRIALIALAMVWGMVFLMITVQWFKGDE